MKDAKLLIFVWLAAIGLMLSPLAAKANCMWTLNANCGDIGKTNAWTESTNASYCQATVKPNGETVKCCCASGDVLGCCEKTNDRNEVTAENMTGEACRSIPYAATVFYQDFTAQDNRCVPKNAYEGCTWRSAGACQNGETLADGSQCTGEKPAAKIIHNEPIQPGCCCTKTTTKLPTVPQAPEPPKFTMPELQVSLPGLNLTPSSSISYTPNEDGSYKVSIPWLAEYIQAIYNYGLSVAGILAALVLIGGGLLWLISGGDASRITQAKELIAGSITGLIILFSSYIILIQINPDLIKLKPISIGTVKELDLEPVSNAGNPNNSRTCENCVTLDSQIPAKNGRQINKDLNDKLKNAWAGSNGIAWRVTEAYPPSSEHKSTCHYNGMCADLALTGNLDCSNVNKLITVLQNAGLRVLNEYISCSGVKTDYATGGHLHVR
ncbi:MAG: pilin [Patescibacteria group bacterium]